MVEDKIIILNLKSNNQNDVNHYFNCAYEKYFRLVAFCISKIINNKNDIEDLVNEVFISLYENKDSLDEDKNLKYYLTTIAKNKAISYLRSNNETIPLDESYNFKTYYKVDYTDEIIGKLKEVLDDFEISIIVNHLIYGYSFIEISSIENVPLGSITTKYRRALKKASKIIKREDYE